MNEIKSTGSIFPFLPFLAKKTKGKKMKYLQPGKNESCAE